MKALSINQPFGGLIVDGFKDIENRSWYTSYRGTFLIHVGLNKCLDDIPWCESILGMKLAQNFQTGGIIGQADIVDVCTESESPWFVGKYGFILRDAKRLPFRPCKGALGFFEPDYNSLYKRDQDPPQSAQQQLL